MKTFKVLYFWFSPDSRGKNLISRTGSVPRDDDYVLFLLRLYYYYYYFYNWYNPRLEQTTSNTIFRADKGDDFGQA